MPAERLVNTVTVQATNAKVATDTSTIFVMRRLRLGCGRWRAFIGERGGGVSAELAYASLNMGRRVDDMSSASVTLDAASLSSFTPAEQEACCGILAEIEPWEHELQLWREGDLDTDDPTWAGPVIAPKWSVSDAGAQQLVVSARDLFQWFERRILELSHDFTGVDLATIFYWYVTDALLTDPSPNITFAASPTGVLGDRQIDPLAFRRAADELRELARSGLDFTMIGRTLIVGGTEIPTADLGTLITEHFRSLELSVDGLSTETESTVVGARPSDGGAPVYGAAGGLDPDRGLVQNVTNETTILDAVSVQAAANSRLDLLGETPLLVSGVLSAEAPVSFDLLIPGARAELRLQFFCREVVGEFRLQDVSVQVGSDGSESVGVTFSTLGTTEEA